jgi:hypothetical protein
MNEACETIKDGGVHVCLVSKELLPNLIPVLMLRPAQVHLVITDDMHAPGNRLRTLLEQKKINVSCHYHAPSVRMAAVREFARGVAEAIASESSPVILNATGGTKPMALGFVDVFRERRDVTVVYTDTDHGMLEVLSPPDTPPIPLRNVLSCRDYLAARGLKMKSARSGSTAWRAGAERRRAVTAKLAALAAASRNDFIADMHKAALDALDRSGSKLVAPRQQLRNEPQAPVRDLLASAETLGLVQFAAPNVIVFSSAEGADYFSGKWLEEVAWHAVCEAGPQETLAGVVVSLGGDPPNFNEIDLIATDHNRILLIECKAGRLGRDDVKAKSAIYKLDSIGAAAGGPFGQRLLFAAAALSDEEKTRAKKLKLDVIDSANISALVEYVRHWIGGRPGAAPEKQALPEGEAAQQACGGLECG